MDEESANWCRLVQTIIHKGGEVLRQFLQLEILTKIFTKYSRFWMNNVHNPCDINYMEILANNLNRILIGSDNPSEKIIEELLDSWSTTHGQRMTVIEQIDRLKEWKHDVDNKCLNSVSSSDKIILNNCLSQIEQEIEKLDSIWTFLNKWDYTFHCNLQIAQTDLLSEIEKNDEFLSRCRYVLTSLSKPSSTEFQQHVRSFKKELNIWKIKCSKVLRGFKEECDTLIASGLREIKCSPQLNILNRFLTDFKMNINNENLQSQIDIFCDTWDDDLHHLFDRYEKKIQDSDSTAILSLSQSLCKDLEKFPTFKEKKFQDFLLTATKLPGLSTIERSKLKDISRCSNLNEFDFNLLIAVLMHGNFVHSPPPNRDEDPHKLDISISADILRLRAYRNNIVDHTVQVKISSDTFDKLWKELLMLLRKIASQCGDNFNKKISMEIDQMKDHPLEPHRETKLQQEFLTWCRKDILNQLTPEAYMYLDILQSLQMAEENLSRRRQARTCCSCKKEFPTESELEKHTRIHKDCRCRSCNKEFLTESELQLHMKYHEARTCLRCNMECSTEKGLARHMMCHQAHICLSCNQAFSTGIELEQHLRYHQACTCRSCSMEFPTENELAEHVRNHKGDHNAPEIQVRNERKQFAIDETSKLIEQDTSQKRPARDDNYDLQTQKKQKVDKEQSSVETEIHPSVQNMEDSEEDAEGGNGITAV